MVNGALIHKKLHYFWHKTKKKCFKINKYETKELEHILDTK